ncbi:MAG TPA: dihydrolipoamide acetyltransferase family protein [Candidatus Eisenbacteria bacterium]|jgi:2-oxoglutarate dehydrogenase E2 component (dihydrolipoamide succinyltransferase)
MPVTIVVPQLGESVVEGTVGKWLKKEGEPIAKDEPIVEIITDKINIELPAPAAGTLGKITVPEGTVAQVGQQLGVILLQGESLPAGAQAAPAGPQQSNARPPAPPAPSPAGGAPAREPAPARAGAAVAEAPSGEDQRVSPAVRKLLKEHSLDVSGIRGSGMGGRVTREDVLNHIEAGKVAASAGAGAPAREPAPGAAPGRAPVAPQPLKPVPAAAFAQPGSREEVVQPLSNVRKKIAENMLRSRHSAAHCSTWDEVDMTALVEMRARLKERIKTTYGVNLTYTPFIMKAVVRALREFPILNASMTESEVHYKKYYNIGVAVHREQGLIVPVVHDADRKTLLQLAQEIEDLGGRARADKLTLNDIQGGTFTITNAGMFGATASTPIINYPEVGVLGVHLIQERPVVRDHRIVIRQMMTLVLSFDHRLVDGTPAVQFLHRVKELLEDPESWLLDSI